eukprot:PhF_6_TR2522/c0_g1_i3/m.4283
MSGWYPPVEEEECNYVHIVVAEEEPQICGCIGCKTIFVPNLGSQHSDTFETHAGCEVTYRTEMNAGRPTQTLNPNLFRFSPSYWKSIRVRVDHMMVMRLGKGLASSHYRTSCCKNTQTNHTLTQSFLTQETADDAVMTLSRQPRFQGFQQTKFRYPILGTQRGESGSEEERGETTTDLPVARKPTKKSCREGGDTTPEPKKTTKKKSGVARGGGKQQQPSAGDNETKEIKAEEVKQPIAWICAQCTFHNDEVTSKRCGMCRAHRQVTSELIYED